MTFVLKTQAEVSIIDFNAYIRRAAMTRVTWWTTRIKCSVKQISRHVYLGDEIWIWISADERSSNTCI